MRKIIMLAVLLVLVLPACFASISLTPEARSVTVSRNDSIGVRFTLRNSGDRECIDLGTEYDSRYIETSLLRDRICLNRNESVNVTVTVRTENARRGRYEVILVAEAGSEEDEAKIDLHVGEEPEVELVAYDNDVCRGERDYVNVLVRNNSNESKHVELQAENEMLLPYFERNELYLGPFEEEYVKLRVHPSPYSSLGAHYISMMAITEDEISRDRISVDVEDCEEEELEFRVRAGSGCFTVEKGEVEKIYFTVENLSEEEQKVYFSVGGDLVARLSTQSAWLEENEERDFYFIVNMDKDSVVKDYDMVLRVWNQDFSVRKSVCIRPRREHSASVEVEQNSLEIEGCGSAVFTITVKNEGDYSEDFELDIENPYSKVEAVLSEEDFELEKHSSREVYVSVSLSEGLEEGSYEIGLVVETRDSEFEQSLKFEVVEEREEPVETGKVEINGYASSIALDENSEKVLLVSIKNNSEEPVTGITVRLLGLVQGLESEPVRNVWLNAGEEKTVELALKALEASAGEYSAIIYAGNAGFSEQKNIAIIVEAIAGEEDEDIDLTVSSLLGMFIAGGSALLGLFLLVILILAVVLIARALRKPEQKEIWMRG